MRNVSADTDYLSETAGNATSDSLLRAECYVADGLAICEACVILGFERIWTYQ